MSGHELRMCCSLPLILIFIDLCHAFDEADKDDMRLALFEAGVEGKPWLLLDDLLASDHSRIHPGDYVSSVFALAHGTAQGRRVSTDMFNGVIRFFQSPLP